MNQFQPYIGLRPFTENERDRFFGRRREISILLDKIRANRLTLLLAASGVGKSSLLQAGIMPALRADGNTELIYHRDWAALPQVFKQAVSSHYGEPYKEVPLKSILRACTLFSSGQQILLLDQFEEFFNYHRFRQEFLPFVEELSAAILDRSTPASFVLSMREDFALELNAFKPFLPGVFDNYFRLEKLTREQARQAIEEPLKPTGWCFEPEQGGRTALLEQVLDDLAKREQERQFGVQELLTLKELPLLVEPPHLQIVCQELWLHHRDEAAKQISHAAYDKAGGTKGILEDYFLRKIALFSQREQRLASAAFDHLIGQRATKIAHPLDRLAELTGFQEPDLGPVLDKLQDAAILRRQQRDRVFWYELYHDIFSESIDAWNREFKARLRRKRLAIRGIAALVVGGLLFAGNNWRANQYGRWLQSQEGVFNRIEVNRGTENGLDVFGLRGFLYESPFLRQELEADKRFDRSLVEDKQNAQANLVGRLPLGDRLSVYAENGLYRKIYRSKEADEDQFVESILKTGEYSLINQLPVQLAKIRTAKSVALLLQLSEKQKKKDSDVLYSLAQLGDSSALADLRKLISDENEYTRLAAAHALCKLGDISSAPELVKLLANATYKDTRKDVASALGKLGDRSIVSELIKLLASADKYVRMYAAALLGNLGDSSTVPELVKLLDDKSENVRQAVAKVLGNLGDSSATPVLVKLLADEDAEVRQSAAEAIGELGDNSILPELLKHLADMDADVRQATMYALGSLGDSSVAPQLVQFLKDANEYVRWAAVSALGSLSDSSITPQLVQFLKEGNAKARKSAANTLSSLGDSSVAPQLVQFLKDAEEDVRLSVAEAIGRLGDTSAVPELIKFLSHEKPYVQLRAATVLGSLGDRTAAPALLNLLADRNENIRLRAADALGDLGDSAAVPALVKIIADKYSYMRQDAAEALSSLGDSSVVPVLMGMLKNTDVRTAAVAALGRLRVTQAVAEIIRLQLLERGNWESQQTAAFALAQMNASAPELETWRQRAFNKAQEKFAAQNAFQRRKAAELLCAIATEPSAALLVQLINDSNIQVKEEAVRQTGLLAELHPEWIKPEPLLALLNQPNVNLRRAAIKALGQLVSFQGEKEPSDLPDVEQKVHAVLITLVSAEQKDFAARQAALDALGAAGRYGQELFDFLAKLDKKKDDSLRYRCLHWLGRMEYPAAKDYVENELKELEQEKAVWREERQKDVDTAGVAIKQEDKTWPKEHWEYLLGNALARIAPETRGIELLGHPLHQVRQGAVRALAGKANAALISKIIQAHQGFNPDDLPSPFPYTAFQAIDLALWNLEYTGTKDDLATLQSMKLEPCKIPGQEGAIEERLEWTIKRLGERFATD